MQTTHTFLRELQKQAKQQAHLHQTRLLPKQLDLLTALVGNYPWQTLLVTSGITSLVWELFSFV